VMKIGKQLTEVLHCHLKLNRKSAMKRAVELLDSVGIPMPEQRVEQYQRFNSLPEFRSNRYVLRSLDALTDPHAYPRKNGRRDLQSGHEKRDFCPGAVHGEARSFAQRRIEPEALRSNW